MHIYFQDGIEEVWTDGDDESASNAAATQSVFPPVLNFLFTSLIVWQLTFSISDAAVKVMMTILRKFIVLVSDLLKSDELKKVTDHVPKAYKRLLKFVGLECNNIILYVVCPSCNCVYNYEQCLETRSGRTIVHKYQYVAFPNHIHRDQRGPCNSPLLKEVRINNGSKVHFVPIKSYPYQSLKKGISALVSNPAPFVIQHYFMLYQMETVASFF